MHQDVPDHPSDLVWDDVADVVCVGAGLGVLAYAISCVDRDQDVLLADTGSLMDVSDGATHDYINNWIDGIGPLIHHSYDPELPLTRVAPAHPVSVKQGKVDSFYGAQLQQWAIQCVMSPYGVLCTDLPDAGMRVMRTEAGESIQAAVIGAYPCDPGHQERQELSRWLDEQANARGISRDSAMVAHRLIFERGRVAGIELVTPTSSLLVQARHGVAFCIQPRGSDLPADISRCPAETFAGVAQLAVVGRSASRFTRLELLAGQ